VESVTEKWFYFIVLQEQQIDFKKTQKERLQLHKLKEKQEKINFLVNSGHRGPPLMFAL
jgi:hypothetical protein